MARRSIEILKPHAWHPDDRLAWAAATDPGKPPFVAPGKASRWSSQTRRGVEQAVGQFLGWVRGRRPEIRRLGDVYAINDVRDYLRELAVTSSRHTLITRIGGLGRGLRAISGCYPSDDLICLRSYVDAVGIGAPAKRPDVPLADDLLELGRSLMRNAGWPDPETADPRALIGFRDGLMIALLATHPLRLGVFTDLTLGRDIHLDGDEVRVRIEAARQKSRRATGGVVKPELVQPLHHYLETVRPWLLARSSDPIETDRLWITDRGTGIDPTTIHKMFRRRTRAGLGRAIGPHKVRHAAATYVAITAPHLIAIISGVLSHRRLATAQEHYNLAGSVEAFRRWHRVIKAIRRTAS